MSVQRPLFIRKDEVMGTSPKASRLALAGLIAGPASGARPGVLRGLEVVGTSGWTYTVSAGHLVTAKSAGDGAALWGLDASVTVATSPAPASGSRIDIVYAAHNDIEQGDPDSAPVLGVAQGAASGSPSAPSLPAGAVELRRFTLPSGATGTQGGTPSNTGRQHTATHGSPIPVTGTAQRNAIGWGTQANPARVLRLDTGVEETNYGSGWSHQLVRPSGAGTMPGGWSSATGWARNGEDLALNYVLRDGDKRQHMLELRRTGSAISLAANGSVPSASREVVTLAPEDAPGAIVTGTYLYRDGGVTRMGEYYISSAGTVFVAAGNPSTEITQRGAGEGWSVRIFCHYTIVPPA